VEEPNLCTGKTGRSHEGKALTPISRVGRLGFKGGKEARVTHEAAGREEKKETDWSEEVHLTC